MKRNLFTLTLLLAGALNLLAKPIDLTKAQEAAQKFASVKFAVERQNIDLVYTGPEGAFYVFNIPGNRFVIIAADDAYRPVIGYSDESEFDSNNIPPALVDYLDGIAMSINTLRSHGNAVATPLVAAEWESLLSRGELLSLHGGKGVDHLCQTQWDQSYPYNYYCPEDPAGSHGHTYVGCLATAMAQLMAFWKDPVHGNGSHCYYHDDYGEICADFENTNYDWDHIANKITENSPIEEIQAVALVSFHCGVIIDMGYGPDGSGGASGPIPGAMHDYYNYSNANIQLRRNDYETETWKALVREQFDMGWPMYYGGCDDGCHAFVCDGYDDNDLFHFNLGWGGSSDGWYIIDEAPYTNPADAMFNFVPGSVYDQTPQAPTAFTVTPAPNNELRTTISWTNPTKTLNWTTLSSIDQVIVKRDNEIIYTLDNPTPGATIQIEDANVPRYDTYNYSVYVNKNGHCGKHANAKVMVGPSSTWRIVKASGSSQGWNRGYVTVYNNAGHIVGYSTLESNVATSTEIQLPLGNVSFSWTLPPHDAVENMNIIIKDANNQTVYNFSGSSDELTPGVFFSANNGVDNGMTCEVPENLVATVEGEGNVQLTWDAVTEVGYGYNVYRDGVLIRSLSTGNSLLDENLSLGGHCYQLTVLCDGGESELSNESCANIGENCDPPYDLGYYMNTNGNIPRPVVTWSYDGVGDYEVALFRIFRKVNEDGEYKKVKDVAKNKREWKDTGTLIHENVYYYKVVAYYYDVPSEFECFSAPALSMYDDNEYYVRVVYDEFLDVDEIVDGNVNLYPNPTNGSFTIEAENIQQVTVYNTVGQLVYSQDCEGNNAVIRLGDMGAGLYMVKVVTANGESVKKVSVIR